MGKQRIKLRTTEQKANFYAARPWSYSRWQRLKLKVLGWLGRAKKYEATEVDPKTGTRTTLRGYAYKGDLYLTEQEVFTPTSFHIGKKGEAKLEPRP